MADSHPVLVIGGGVIGVCSAYYLTECGREVVLIDKDDVCAGASYGNAGLILPSHGIPLASPGALGSGLKWLLDPDSPFYIKPSPDADLISWLLRFVTHSNMAHVRRSVPVLHSLHGASIELYEEISREENLRFGFERRGMFSLYSTEGGYEAGLKDAALLGEFGVHFEAMDGDAVREREPSLSDEIAGGIYYPDDGHLIPAEFVHGLARVIAERGVDIRPGVEVLGFYVRQRHITAVHTTRGDIAPAEVVLAAGAWSAPIGRELGLRLPIQPAKGYSITVKRPATCPSTPLLHSETRVAVTPMGDAMRLAGTLEIAGFDMAIRMRRVDAILKGARSFVRGLEELEVMEIWRGLRPCTPDGIPIIGRSRLYDNLTVAAGHATIGQSLGPITGRLVSQIVSGAATDVDLKPLRMERF